MQRPLKGDDTSMKRSAVKHYGIAAAVIRAGLLLALLSMPAPGPGLKAQLTGISRANPDTDSALEVSPASPRASVQQFLKLGDNHAWESAKEYLNLPAGSRDRGVEFAQKLHYLLQQRTAIDVRRLSPLAVGDTTDGERNADVIGSILVKELDVPVRMVRVTNAIPPHWNFAETTVARIDELIDGIGVPGFYRYIPRSLMQEGPLHIYLWQWFALAAMIPLLIGASWLVSLILRKPLGRLVLRTEADWDDKLLEDLRGPFRLWISALGISPVVKLLDINVTVAAFIDSAARGFVLLAIFWALLRVIRVTQNRMEHAAIEHGQIEARTLIPLLGNILRMGLAIVALLIALAQFGYPVTTLLAGLGIGGIAIALAAQKTVEHLFGSVSLAADRAFRVGDWVRAGTTEGSVERIGLRSTSFRTNERTVIRVPNGRLAEERIETFGERDRMLLRTDLDLTYDTSAEQLNAVCEEIKDVIRGHPRAWLGGMRVHVVAFTDSAIRIGILAWFRTTSQDEFLDIRHKLYLEFMRIVERNGSDFAFPSRTVYLASGKADSVARPPGAPVQQQ